MTLTNLQNQNWHDQLGVKTLFSNYIVNNRFDDNKDVSLYSMKYMFDNDLNLVPKYVLNKFPSIYNNIAISSEWI